METDESTAQLQPKISAMYFSKLKEGIKIDKYEQSLRKKKLSKFTRDTLDYKHVNVYPWLNEAIQTLRKQICSGDSPTLESSASSLPSNSVMF